MAKKQNKTYELDPDTRKLVFDTIQEEYEECVENVVGEGEEEFFEELDWRDVSNLFYFNGFLHGCLKTAVNSDFLEAIKLMKEELEYQRNNGMVK